LTRDIGRGARSSIAMATAGLATTALATGGLALLGDRPFLGVVEIPALTLAAGLAATAIARHGLVRASRFNVENDPEGRGERLAYLQTAAGGLLAILVALPVATAFPSLLEWVIALAGGLGFVVFVENATLAAKFLHVAAAAPPGTIARLDAAASAVRAGQLRLLAIAAAIVLVAVLMGPTIFGLLHPVLGASVEARSLHGAAVLVGLTTLASLGYLALKTRRAA